ncbi:glucan biosynthesis protein G [Herbaspirillum sp. RTI4]|nr:glucan biosynthesis protein G [Herbaspirillum sp. RTI4]MDY7578101.1 glucan biosynthesis protein G [Herbaspirillum sp. RTI4]MEA9980690.1 glucan biosynthesis protein G [Herbaspirillum sp. RTI4]
MPRLLLGALSALLLLQASTAGAFDLDDVAKRARTLAGKSYQKPDEGIPKDLASISYEQYRDIRYRPERALWKVEKLPFEVSFFHPGSAYTAPVKINDISGSVSREIRFSPALFDYGHNKLDTKQFGKLGFSGLRIAYPLGAKGKGKEDVMSFLGASYFRGVGKAQSYGASARGLAIDTGLYSGEEYPRFVEFWLQRPRANDKELTIYALLDSPRATGAYRFVLKPGADTAIEVKAQLFLRSNVSKLGIAPLSSMFYFGENQSGPDDDYRPKVHDSDGLSIQSGTGEWIWRPLVNPKRLLTTSFELTNPLGFGLMQRDRQFSSYEDLTARFETRPSVWVEPKGKWGAGRIELVQIPTPNEANDNIVAYWIPSVMPVQGKPLNIEYRLLWQKEKDTRPPLASVMQTRFGHGYRTKDDGILSLKVDFEGASLKKLAANAKLDAAVDIDGNGKLVDVRVVRNDVTGGVRLALRLRRTEENKPVELRAFLRSGTTTLSETWSYILPPN